MTDTTGSAQDALLYSPLTYADTTGDTAVRNLQAGMITITWADGSKIYFAQPEARPLVRFIRTFYTYRLSGRHRLWGTWSKKNPGAVPPATGARSESPTAK
ncbi:hypothetical protein ABIC64_002253 [Plantibacter flavus]